MAEKFETMTLSHVVPARLTNQLLGRKKCELPGEVVERLGAVKAQDFAAAKWALGLRMHEAADLDDEYTIAYKDRRLLGGERYIQKLLAMGNALSSVLILDGVIAGTWKRVLKKGKVEVTTSLFRRLRKAEHEALKTAVAGYGAFLGMPCVLKTEQRNEK